MTNHLLILMLMLMSFTSYISSQTANNPTFPNPVRTGTKSIVFTYATTPTHDSICYDNSGTKTVIGNCVLNSLTVTCTEITITTNTDLYSCKKDKPSEAQALSPTLEFRDQAIKSVEPNQLIPFGVPASILINFQFDIIEDDKTKLKYLLTGGSAKEFTQCSSVPFNRKQLSCEGTFRIPGDYSILFDKETVSKFTFTVQNPLDPQFTNVIKPGTGLTISFICSTTPIYYNKIYYFDTTNMPLGDCTSEGKVITCTRITLSKGSYKLFFYLDDTLVGEFTRTLEVTGQGVVSVFPKTIIIDTDVELILSFYYNVNKEEVEKIGYQLSDGEKVLFTSCRLSGKVAICPIKINALGNYNIINGEEDAIDKALSFTVNPPDPEFTNIMKPDITNGFTLVFKRESSLYNSIYYENNANTFEPIGNCDAKNTEITCKEIKLEKNNYDLYFYNVVDSATKIQVGKLSQQLIVKNQGAVSVSPTVIKTNTPSVIDITMDFDVEKGEEKGLVYHYGIDTEVKLTSCTYSGKTITCPINISKARTYQLKYKEGEDQLILFEAEDDLTTEDEETSSHTLTYSVLLLLCILLI